MLRIARGLGLVTLQFNIARRDHRLRIARGLGLVTLKENFYEY